MIPEGAILRILAWIGIIILSLIALGFFLIVLMFIGLFVLSVIFDDVKEIDNTDGHIICGDTNKPCIKDTLYTKCDCCSDCPIRLQENS